MATSPDTVARRERNERRCARILDLASPLATDDLSWGNVGDHELDPDVVACLVYMRDVEGFTDRELVGLTAGRTTIGDVLLVRFLDVWRAEEKAHAAALERFLGEYGHQRNVDVPPRQPPPPATASRFERVVAAVGGPVGRSVTAAHMAWGAANELLTLNGYRLLAARCRHPVLAELLGRIAEQEARHFSFYWLQADWRLASSTTVRVVLRRALARAWTPVGVGRHFKTAEEFTLVAGYLGAGDDGRSAVDRMDRQYARLPGFGGIRIFRRACSSAVERGVVQRACVPSAP